VYTKNNGITLTDDNIAFLDVFAEALPFDIVVTSGMRGADAQVRAVFKKIELGDDINALYGDNYANKYKAFYQNNDFAGAVAYQTQLYKNSNTPWTHGGGFAVDIRTMDKNQSDIDKMIQVANDLGVYQVIQETTPPHLHIGHYDAATYQKKNKLSITILGLIPLIIWITKK